MKTLAFFFAMMVIPLLARIGETNEECDARYGQGELTKVAGTKIYKKAGFEIECSFRDGKVVRMDFSHIEKDSAGQPIKITSAELDALMEANGGGDKWEKGFIGNIFRPGWATEDGTRQAIYGVFECRFMIILTTEAKRISAERDAVEKAKLKGF